MTYQAGPDCINLIKKYVPCKLRAYSVGQIRIGYNTIGSLVKEVTGKSITDKTELKDEQEATNILKEVLNKKYVPHTTNAINSNNKFGKFTQKEFDALLAYSYIYDNVAEVLQGSDKTSIGNFIITKGEKYETVKKAGIGYTSDIVAYGKNIREAIKNLFEGKSF